MVNDKDIQDIKRRAGITEQSHRYEHAQQLIMKAEEAVGHASRALIEVYRHLRNAYSEDEPIQTELDQINTAVGALADMDDVLTGLENNLPE
jgi:hypothetical protein